MHLHINCFLNELLYWSCSLKQIVQEDQFARESDFP